MSHSDNSTNLPIDANAVLLQKRAQRRSKASKQASQLHYQDALEMRQALSQRRSVSSYLRECGYADSFGNTAGDLYADDSYGEVR